MACGCHAHDVKMLQLVRATRRREPNMSMWADISVFLTLRCAETTGLPREVQFVRCRDRCKDKMISLYKLQNSGMNNRCDPFDSFTWLCQISQFSCYLNWHLHMQIIKCHGWLDNNYIHIQPCRGILVKPPLMAPELKTNNSCSDSSVLSSAASDTWPCCCRRGKVGDPFRRRTRPALLVISGHSPARCDACTIVVVQERKQIRAA